MSLSHLIPRKLANGRSTQIEARSLLGKSCTPQMPTSGRSCPRRERPSSHVRTCKPHLRAGNLDRALTSARCDKVIPPSCASGSKALQNSYAVVYPTGVYTINPRCTADGVLLFGGSAPNQKYLLDYIEEDERRRTDDSLINFGKVTDAVEMLARNGFQWWVLVRSRLEAYVDRGQVDK